MSQVDPDKIVGLVSQHGGFDGAFALAPSPEFEKLSQQEKERIYPTLLTWVKYMEMLDIPLNPSFTATVEGKEIPGTGLLPVEGVPSGYFAARGIFSVLVECGDRSAPGGMERFARTVLSGLLSMLREYEMTQ